MKKVTFLFLLILIVVSTSFAQSNQPNYKKIDYISVSENHLKQFISLAKEELKSTYSSLVSSGDFISWRLYKVRYPGGQESKYNFVSVAIASDIDSYENAFSEATTPSFVPNSSNPKQKTHIDNTCSIIKSELWKVENAVSQAEKKDMLSPYLMMDYMNVTAGRGYDYLMLEDEIAKPIHEERMAQDRMRSWEVYSLILPGGINYGYNYATGNYFDKIAHIEFGFTDEIIRQTMGENSNVSELFDTIYSTRDRVKSELWELVVHTN